MVKLSDTQNKCLAWLADDTKEFGCPGGRRTLQSLRNCGFAWVNPETCRWEITDVGRLELGPVALTESGYTQFTEPRP